MMINDKQMLGYIRKTAEMGQIGIDSVLKHVEGGTFRDALEQQYTEYDKIVSQADKMINEMGFEVEEAGMTAKASTEMMTFFQTLNDSSESKIAEMMIMGNSSGVAKSIKHINDYNGDGNISRLANQLLKTEQANIEQMKKFL